MNRVFVTGDTHGGIDIFKLKSKAWPLGKELDKGDFLIIAGDFGLIWDQPHNISKEEIYLLNWLSEKPWTTLFIDGNHENHDRLDKLETVDMFGSDVGRVNDSIFHLRRGRVYNIAGKNIFTFGGGFSIDKARRTEFITWWKQEMPTNEEFKFGLKTLKENNNKVDYIITHSCSNIAFKILNSVYWMGEKADGEDQLRSYFDNLIGLVEHDKWFCGHFHQDYEYEKFTFLYFDIKEL